MHEDFLQAVLAHPAEDAPRLIYADWLEEQGDSERAEFIRLQCELPHLAAEDPRRNQAVRRQIELERMYHDAWRKELLPFPVPPTTRIEFRRGFVEYLQLDAANFAAHGEAIVARTPLRHLSLFNVRGQGKALARSLALHGLQQLDILSEPLERYDLEALARSSSLEPLEVMCLRHVGLTAQHLRALTHASRLNGLRMIDLSFNSLGQDGAEVLAPAALTSQLQELLLFDCHLGNEGAASLARSAFMARLLQLDLGRNQITNTGAAALAQGAHWQALEELYLDENRITSNGARVLLATENLPLLRLLNLQGNRIRLGSPDLRLHTKSGGEVNL